MLIIVKIFRIIFIMIVANKHITLDEKIHIHIHTYIHIVEHTVGVIKNCTLVSVNFSAQDASILKISVPIIKRRS